MESILDMESPGRCTTQLPDRIAQLWREASNSGTLANDGAAWGPSCVEVGGGMP